MYTKYSTGVDVSTDKSTDVENILKRIMTAKKFSRYVQVSKYLGEDPATVSAWKQRNSVSMIDKIINRCRKEINAEYLLTGEGPALVDTKATAEIVISENIRGDPGIHAGASAGPSAIRGADCRGNGAFLIVRNSSVDKPEEDFY